MSDWRNRFLADAADWQSAGLRRQRRVVRPVSATEVEVDARIVTAFASNDYLGLSRHPRLIEAIAEGALEALLRSSTARQKLVVTDAVFSMDGDIAPLGALLALCERHDALLVVDDAHGIGVWGPEGRGSVHALGLQSDCIVYMGTLGKAAGLSGAFVAADQLIIDRLIQRGRPYVFSTASVPALAHATLTALELVRSADAARKQLERHRDRLRGFASAWQPFRLLASAMPIQPLVIGDNSTVVRIAEALLQEGLWVPAIRPPTVPAGSARLRITLSAAHSDGDIGRLGAALSRIISKAGAIPA